jgi:hypothetical protein
MPLTAAKGYKQLSTVSLPCYGLDEGGMVIRSPAGKTDFPSQKCPDPVAYSIGTGDPLPGDPLPGDKAARVWSWRLSSKYSHNWNTCAIKMLVYGEMLKQRGNFINQATIVCQYRMRFRQLSGILSNQWPRGICGCTLALTFWKEPFYIPNNNQDLGLLQDTLQISVFVRITV